MARDYNLSNEEKKQVEAKEKSIREKLRLDKHHKIERFGVTMSVLFVSLLCLTIAVCVKRHNDNKVQLGDTPIYTTSFEMSLTHNEGSVVDIYRNKAGTKTDHPGSYPVFSVYSRSAQYADSHQEYSSQQKKLHYIN